jgi:uracil-DNA glycosylase
VEEQWRELVATRKACRICVQRSPGRIRSCGEFDFDPDVVSHWQQWLGNKKPRLLIVGQDFANVDYFVRYRGHDEPHNQTNDNLQRLLAEAGIHTTDPPEFDPAAPVFATNSILCVKEGRMNGAILASWVNTCADTHLVPLVRYLQPPVVVGMGSYGWRAVRRVFALDDAPRPIAQAAGSSWVAADQTRIFAVGHPGPLGIINRRWQQQLADWRRIGEAVAMASGNDRLDLPAATG